MLRLAEEKGKRRDESRGVVEDSYIHGSTCVHWPCLSTTDEQLTSFCHAPGCGVSPCQNIATLLRRSLPHLDSREGRFPTHGDNPASGAVPEGGPKHKQGRQGQGVQGNDNSVSLSWGEGGRPAFPQSRRLCSVLTWYVCGRMWACLRMFYWYYGGDAT